MPRRTVPMSPAAVAAHCGTAAVRVADLQELGLHRGTIAHRCRPGGPWQSPCPGIVLLHNAAPARDDRRRAALLLVGSGAVLTGLDALELYGLQRVPRPHGPVRVLVPTHRRRAGHGLVVVQRTARLPVPVPGRWPLAPLPRAVLDHTRLCGRRDLVRSAMAEAVQRRMCTPAELGAELAGGGRGVRLSREVLVEIGAGVRSVAEAEARHLLLAAGHASVLWNPTLCDTRTGRTIAMPDAWFDDVAMAWEIDSTECHLAPEDHERTLARRAAMTAAGIWVVAHTPTQVRDHGADVLHALAGNLEQAGRRPRPPILAVPAPTSVPFVA